MVIKSFIKFALAFLKSWLYNIQEYKYLTRLLKQVQPRKDVLKDKVIVFNPTRSLKNIFDREFYLGKLFALHGAKVYMLLDDGVLEHWDFVQLRAYSKVQKIKWYSFNPYRIAFKNPKLVLFYFYMRDMRRRALNAFKDKNLEIKFYSDVIKEVNSKNWEDLKIFAESSTIRFFQSSKLDYTNHDVKHYYNLSLKNSVLSRTLGEYIYINIKPDLFITGHGIYSTWGPAYNYLRQKGINCLVYGSHMTHSLEASKTFVSDLIIQLLSSSKYWVKYKKMPVTKEMKEKVKTYFELRHAYASLDTRELFKDKQNQLLINKNDGYKYHIALFPNVSWDGNVKERHTTFEGIVDWLISTINHIKDNKNIKLYMKSHPSEITVCKNSLKVIDILNQYIDLKNCKNIVIIPPEQRIEPYNFLRSGIDLAIVFDGMLGLEIPYLGIPTITCVKGGFSSVEGANITVTSKEEYFKYLDNIDDLIKEFKANIEERIENLTRYMYWYLYDNTFTLPTLSIKKSSGTDLFQLKKEDFILKESLKTIFFD